MARLRLNGAKILMLAGLLVAGIGTSAALASASNPNGDPPSTVPGSPGDDCSHGNSGKDCRPDPSTNGKDCEDHGNAKGNEDHCLSTTTTPSTSTDHTTTDHTTTDHTTTDHTTTNQTTDHTTTDHTTTDHTTTDHTTTDHTTTTSTTTPSTSTTEVTTTPPPAPPTTSTTPTGGTAGAGTPPTKPELQHALAKQAQGVRAGAASASNPNELPFTGFPAWVIALIGSAMVVSGLALRKLVSAS